MRKLLYLCLVLIAFNAAASPLDIADNAFYTEDWQRVIDTVVDEERNTAQQSFLAACRIRRCAAALALAAEDREAVVPDENGESVSRDPREIVSYYESVYPEIEKIGKGRVDFWNYSAVASFYAAKYYAGKRNSDRVRELLNAADEALRRSALMSAHNKQLWYFASIVYGNSDFAPEFRNLSFAVSFMRRYLMISGQEADVLGLNRLSVLLRERNFSLEEKRTALIEINKNLRTLSDPYKKYRYVEGYMPTTCWYNYAANHVFKNVSDATEADLIDVYLKRKINPATEIGGYILSRLNPPPKREEAPVTEPVSAAENQTGEESLPAGEQAGDGETPSEEKAADSGAQESAETSDSEAPPISE